MILPHQISSSTLLNPLTLCSDEEPLSDEELLYVPAIPIDDSQSTKEQGETERIKRLQRSVADCYRVDPQQLITDGARKVHVAGTRRVEKRASKRGKPSGSAGGKKAKGSARRADRSSRGSTASSASAVKVEKMDVNPDPTAE
eukprot:m.302540 g.302540  ORF g.302540 m.302540 type:complete len:143 (+) comp15886_c1_seq31:4557-4985(+)